LNILHLIPNLKKGGAERLCLDICRSVQNNSNHAVRVITFSDINEYPFLTKKLIYNVLPAHVIPSISRKSEVEVESVQREIDSFNPDVIHVHLFEAMMVVCHLKFSAHLVVHFHDNMVQFENFSWKTLLSKRLLTNFFEKQLVLRKLKGRRVTHLGISNDTMNYMNRVLPRSAKRVKLLNGIDTKRFMRKEDATSSNKEERSIALTMIGSLVEKKGQALAIETIAELKRRGFEIRLYLLGEGPKRAFLEQLIIDLGVQELVELPGNVDLPEAYLWRSTLYLHTAKYEPLGLALLEAMAAGLPVVCTDGKGNRDLIEEGMNGYMMQSRIPEDLADAIQYVLEHPGQHEKTGKYAQTYAQNYDIKAYVEKLLAIYQFN
jgi:glycosyltransferase involved in cell wall biosynthesis